MANVVEVIVKGIDQATKVLSAPIKSIEDLKNGLAKLGPIAVGTAAGVVSAFAALSLHSIHAADEMGKMAQKAGVSTEVLSALGYAAQLSDVPMDELAVGLKFLSQSMVEVATKGFASTNGLNKLGIAVRDEAGNLRDTREVLLDVAES